MRILQLKFQAIWYTKNTFNIAFITIDNINDYVHQLRVVCMSDTHSATHKIKFDIPQGDVFIHAGDFTKTGRLQEVIDFNNWLGNIFTSIVAISTNNKLMNKYLICTGTLPHKNKVVIAGNHELSFDPAHLSNGSMKIHNVKEKLTNCIYLEDSEIIISGIKVYGTPWYVSILPTKSYILHI